MRRRQESALDINLEQLQVGDERGQASAAAITASSQQSRFHATTLDVTANPEIDLRDVQLAIGDRDILVDAHVLLKNGYRYALLGRNGTGKSTLITALADGLIPGLAAGLKIHHVAQIDPGPTASTASVLDCVLDLHLERKDALDDRAALARMLENSDDAGHVQWHAYRLRKAERALDAQRRVAQFRSGARGKEARAQETLLERRVEEAQKSGPTEQATWLAHATEELHKVDAALDLMDADSVPEQARRVLLGLGFTPDMLTARYDTLSGGWRSRTRLALALILDVDFLLLDEPTNFCDLATTLWLEQYLLSSTHHGTLVVTSHDQVFLDRLAERTIVLRDQKLDYFEGTPSAMSAVEQEERRSKLKQIAALDKKKEHIEASIASGRKAAKATNDDNRMRMAKSRQKKLDDRWGLERGANGGRFKLNRDLAGYHLTSRAEISVRDDDAEVRLRLPAPTELRTKGPLVSLEHVDVGYSKRQAIVSGVSLTVHPGDRVALVGDNGKGKSTIARTIAGGLAALKGEVTRNSSLKIGFFNQHAVEQLNDARSATLTALAYFGETIEKLYGPVTEAAAWACLGHVGLGGSAAVPLAALSGGQKVRLVLAIVLYPSPNLLVLDEVTTHLDLPTIRALAKAITAWSGAVLLISHDRWFNTVTVEGKPIDADVNSAEAETANGLVGTSYLVNKGQMRVLDGGIGEYAKLIERRIARKAKLGEA